MSLTSLARRIITKVRKRGFYYLQKSSGFRVDTDLEQRVGDQVRSILSDTPPPSLSPEVRQLAEFNLEDTRRFRLVRPDIYKTFEASADGPDEDDFGRPGIWKSRGVLIHEDLDQNLIIKTFPPAFTKSGEGRFIEPAIKAGFYDHLCPLLSFLIRNEEGALVGYAMKKGRILSHFEFERLVDNTLRPLVCKATEESGYYFYDLIDHNVITLDSRISLIDIESVLPVEWFEKPPAFAAEHLDVIDIGWPLQTKWRSPDWYATLIRSLQA